MGTRKEPGPQSKDGAIERREVGMTRNEVLFAVRAAGEHPLPARPLAVALLILPWAEYLKPLRRRASGKLTSRLH